MAEYYVVRAYVGEETVGVWEEYSRDAGFSRYINCSFSKSYSMVSLSMVTSGGEEILSVSIMEGE